MDDLSSLIEGNLQVSEETQRMLSTWLNYFMIYYLYEKWRNTSCTNVLDINIRLKQISRDLPGKAGSFRFIRQFLLAALQRIVSAGGAPPRRMQTLKLLIDCTDERATSGSEVWRLKPAGIRIIRLDLKAQNLLNWRCAIAKHTALFRLNALASTFFLLFLSFFW